MKRIILLVFLVSCKSVQQSKTMQATTGNTVKFNLKGANNQPLMIIPVSVNESGPYDFVFDLGASTTVISPELASNLKISAGESRQAAGAGGTSQVSISKAGSIRLGNIKVDSAQVAISPQISFIAKTLGIDKLAGMLGANIWNNNVIRINYRDSTMTFLKNLTVNQLAGFNAYSIRQTTNPAKKLILVQVMINGKGPFNFVMDTGASSCALATETAKQLNLKVDSLGDIGGFAGPIRVNQSIVNSIAIGKDTLNNSRILVGDFFQQLSAIAGEKLDGIIGINFLVKHIVLIDTRKNQLYLSRIKKP
jgi:predicted aspartyl protease